MSSTVTSSMATEPWGETTLGELVEYITSGSRDWSRYYADSGAIFIRTQDINQNRLSLKEIAFVKLPEKVEGKRSLVRKGDLLITITGANVGKVAVVEGEVPEAYVSQSVCLVRLKDPALAKFVHLQLIAKRGDKTTVEAMAYGLGRPVLNLENIRSAPIRIAPAIAQVVIVEEIEKQFSRLDEAVANLKRTKANLKRYKASVLKAAVEGKLTEDWRKQHPTIEPASKLLERILSERRAKWNGRGKYQEPSSPNTSGLPKLPHGWTWATWDQIGFSQNGRAFPSAQYQTSGFKLLRPGNLHVAGKVVWTEENTRCMPRKWADEFPGFIVGPRELIMNLTAQSLKDEFLGRVCLTGPGEACLLNQRQARLTPVLVIPEFLLRLFKSSVFRRFVDGLNTGSLIQHMFTSQLADFVLPLPSLNEQHQIVAEVERRLSVIEELEAAVNANLTRADRLRQSILATAFAGKLVETNPARMMRGGTDIQMTRSLQ